MNKCKECKHGITNLCKTNKPCINHSQFEGIKMENSCEKCARLLKIVNSRTKFCVTEKGILYFVDEDWYKKNDCKEQVNKFCLRKK